MATYPKLLTALLKSGLDDLGFYKANGYLIRDMGDCVGGIHFQKSKYYSNQFFIEAGVLSKRIDRHLMRQTTASDKRPYTWQRSQFRKRLVSDAADLNDDKWILKSAGPPDELVSRLSPVISREAVRIFDALGTDEKMMAALISDQDPCGYAVCRGQEWPAVCDALVMAVVIAHDIAPDAVSRYSEMAVSAASRDSERLAVQGALEQVGQTPIEPSDMMPAEALDELRRMTGQDFGDDYEAWRKWLRDNPLPKLEDNN